MKKIKLIGFFIFPSIFATGCLTRAPTTYELDRRAGMLPPNQIQVKDDLSRMQTSSNFARQSQMPVRLSPLVEKIWVNSQILPDGSKLDGTWMWIEVEKSKWLDENDPGSAPLVIGQIK